jgi:hypothetical protein
MIDTNEKTPQYLACLGKNTEGPLFLTIYTFRLQFSNQHLYPFQRVNLLTHSQATSSY